MASKGVCGSSAGIFQRVAAVRRSILLTHVTAKCHGLTEAIASGSASRAIRLGENPGFRVSIRIGCLDRIVSIRSILSEQISVA
jgi:hypothetical protein